MDRDHRIAGEHASRHVELTARPRHATSATVERVVLSRHAGWVGVAVAALAVLAREAAPPGRGGGRSGPAPRGLPPAGPRGQRVAAPAVSASTMMIGPGASENEVSAATASTRAVCHRG